jgi:hypothetical protein
MLNFLLGNWDDSESGVGEALCGWFSRAQFQSVIFLLCYGVRGWFWSVNGKAECLNNFFHGIIPFWIQFFSFRAKSTVATLSLVL